MATSSRAWRTYLRKYNHGRGVVLIGHSQGTGMLNELLSTEIERKKRQRRKLISAILLGGNVTVRKGEDVGGTFKRTPLCHSRKQIRCVIAFSTFNETPPDDAVFGRTDGPFAAVPAGADPNDYRVACTNPAALGGGAGRLETLARSEPFPGTLGVGITIMYGGPQPTADTPWLTPQDHYSRPLRPRQRRRCPDHLLDRRRQGPQPLAAAELGPASARRERRARQPGRHRSHPGQALPEAQLAR